MQRWLTEQPFAIALNCTLYWALHSNLCGYYKHYFMCNFISASMPVVVMVMIPATHCASKYTHSAVLVHSQRFIQVKSQLTDWKYLSPLNFHSQMQLLNFLTRLRVSPLVLYIIRCTWLMQVVGLHSIIVVAFRSITVCDASLLLCSVLSIALFTHFSHII